MNVYHHLLPVVVTICLLPRSAMSAETVFGVFPRTVIPPALATNVAQNVFLPGALNLRFGMTRDEVFKTCPSLEHDAAFHQKYFLGFTQPVILQNELKGIEFSGGFPKPSRITVNATVAWLLGVFGAPDTAFEERTKDRGRFGLIWKRSDFAVACWFVSSESGERFNAFLKLVPPTSKMEQILSSREGRELPKTLQSILANFNNWTETVARLEAKSPSPATSSAGPPAISIESLEKYEVLSGEGLSGSAFIIQYQYKLYGVCSLHQFDGKTPGSLEPLKGASVQLDKAYAIKQKDVQAIPLRFPQQRIPFLTYNPVFTLQPDEEILVLGPSGGVELGIIITPKTERGSYNSAAGPRQFVARMAKPFVAAGGSGCPIIQKSTGTVIGVLLSADHAEKAGVVQFETLCLPK